MSFGRELGIPIIVHIWFLSEHRGCLNLHITSPIERPFLLPFFFFPLCSILFIFERKSILLAFDVLSPFLLAYQVSSWRDFMKSGKKVRYTLLFFVWAILYNCLNEIKEWKSIVNSTPSGQERRNSTSEAQDRRPQQIVCSEACKERLIASSGSIGSVIEGKTELL